MDAGTYTALIEQCFPHLTIRSARPISEGWDSFVLEINNKLIFRFPRRADVEEQLTREMHLLPPLARTLSTPIPHFDYIWHGNSSQPLPFVGYRKIDGVPLDNIRITPAHYSTLATSLATFLSELHSFPIAQAIQLGVPGHTQAQWRQRYQHLYEEVQKLVLPRLNESARGKVRRLWEMFLDDEANFEFQPAFIHQDLGCEHILCDPTGGMLAGVIDWGDATVGDPALDFVGLLHCRDRSFTERVRASYRGHLGSSFRQRTAFYLRCLPFHELLYASSTQSETNLAHGLASLHVMLDQ